MRLMLNEAVCSPGNPPLQVLNKTRLFSPFLLSKNAHNPLKQKGREGRNIKSSHKFSKVFFFFFFSGLSF